MNDPAPHRPYEFAGFILDPQRGRLNRADGRPIELPVEQFDALLYLVRNAGKTVSRAELAKELWPEDAVEDNNLGQVMQALRTTLGDSSAALIGTLPRGGYRMMVTVRRREPIAATAAAAPASTQEGPQSNWWAVAALVLVAAGVPIAWNWYDAETPDDAAARMVGTASADAYTAYLKAVTLYRSQGGIGVAMSRQSRDEMIGHLDVALRSDPAFPAALAWKANTELDVLLTSPATGADSAQRDALLQEAVGTHARAALAGDAALGIGHIAVARLAMYDGRFDEARDALRKALAANPADTMARHYGAVLQCLQQQPAEGRQLAQRAIEADPHDPARCGASTADHDATAGSGG
jgi:DNA-binding winged helix-turn-helix (wHTH) protein